MQKKENPKRKAPYCDFSFVPKSLQKQPWYANRAWEEPGSATAGILIQVQSWRWNSKAPDSNQKKNTKGGTVGKPVILSPVALIATKTSNYVSKQLCPALLEYINVIQKESHAAWTAIA